MNPTPRVHGRKNFKNIWEQRVFEFRISKETILTFPANLTNVDRKEIHRFCVKYGLISKSRGKEPNRCLTVTKGKRKDRIRDEDRFYSFLVSSHSQALFQEHFRQFPPRPDELSRARLTTDQTTQNANKEKKDSKKVKAQLDRRRRNVKPEVLEWSVEEVQRRWAGYQSSKGSKAGEALREFHKTLPVSDYREEIISTVKTNQVVLISGETGSGKTTQVPQFILDDAWSEGKPCRIVCTQPRRIAAIMVASRVAEERGENIGKSVGYRIMLEKEEGPETALIYATAGTVLKTLANEAFNGEWTHLILDEIHERDHCSDFLLILVRDLLPKHPELKVVLMSATLHKDLFVKYFGNCPSLHIQGRMFPVQHFYLEDILPELSEYDKPSVEPKQLFATHQERKQLEEAIESAFLSVSDSAMMNLEEAASGHPHHNWINLQHSRTGLTPLAVAVIHGCSDFVQRFLDKGADPRIRAGNGMNCLQWAHQLNRTEILQSLNDHLVKMEAQLVLAGYQPPRNGDVDYALLVCLIKQLCFEKSWKGLQAAGSILVFLSGWKEINNLRQELLSSGLTSNKAWIVCLHSAVAPRDQKLAFQRAKPGLRKIVISTPIAETSITIDDISVIINCGRMKEKSYDPFSGVNTLQTRWISKANEIQRAGRAGRCQEGLAFHIYTKQEAEKLDEFVQPEICRISLDEICLQATICVENTRGKLSVQKFLEKAPDPPPEEAIGNALSLLKEIGALREDESLTVLGRRLASLPMDPKTGKMILYGVLFRCLDPILTATCVISHRSPWVLTVNNDDAVRETREKMSRPLGGGSDHLATVHAFNQWKRSRNREQFARENFLSKETLFMIEGMKTKIMTELRSHGMVLDSSYLDQQSSNSGLLRSVLACGLYPLIGTLSKKNRIRMKVRSVDLLGSSVNFVLRPEPYDPTDPPACSVLVFDEITKGEHKVYVRDTTALNAHPLPIIASDLQIRDVEEFPEGFQHSEDGPQNYKAIVIDNWLTFLADKSIAESLALLRIRLQDAFAQKVSNPRERLPVALEDAMNTISSYFIKESGELSSTLQTMTSDRRPRRDGSSSETNNARIQNPHGQYKRGRQRGRGSRHSFRRDGYRNGQDRFAQSRKHH